MSVAKCLANLNKLFLRLWVGVLSHKFEYFQGWCFFILYTLFKPAMASRVTNAFSQMNKDNLLHERVQYLSGGLRFNLYFL